MRLFPLLARLAVSSLILLVTILQPGWAEEAGPGHDLGGSGHSATIVPPDSTTGALVEQEAVGGVVLDGLTRAPLSGVQVVVEGTELGSLTDNRGRFRIEGVQGTEVTLRFIYIGYREVTEVVQVGDMDLRVELESATIELDQIVVTGTPGGEQRRSIGNSVSRIDVTRDVALAPVQTIDHLLNGRAPGVAVVSASGQAGGGSHITMRGRSSLSLNTNPIVYVDGVRINSGVGGDAYYGYGALTQASRLNDLNPNEIESVEIIRGPAAATLYGTEAANGVIQIITKRGQPGGRPRVSMTVRQGANWFGDASNRIGDSYWVNPATNAVESVNFVEAEEDRGTPVFRVGHLQGYDLSVNGGAEDIQYFASAGFERNEGMESNNTADKFSSRLNLTLTPHRTVDADLKMGLVRSDASYAGTSFESSYLGLFVAQPSDINTLSRGFLYTPHDLFRELHSLTEEVNRYTGAFNIRHRPTGWLNHQLQVGVDISNSVAEDLYRNYAPALPFEPELALGYKEVQEQRVVNTTLDYNATAKADITDAISSSTSLGLQYYERNATFIGLAAENFPAGGIKTTAGAGTILGAYDDLVDNTTVGLYVQERIGFNGRFFLTGAIRADDNSAFGEEFDLVTYPKVSASWVVSEESFWSVPVVSALKLRAAFGAAGKQPLAFAAVRRYGAVPGPEGTVGVTPQTLGNPDLKPERSEELELGFEAGLLDDRFGLDFTYYHQKTKDAIVESAAPISSGFPGNRFINGGEIKNTGVEVLLTGRALDTRAVDVDFSASLSTNDSEILSLGLEGVDYITVRRVNRHQPGFPVGALFGYRVLSADRGPDGGPTNAMCDGGTGTGGVEPGGAPVPCDEAPQVYRGRVSPSYQGAFSANVSFLDRFRLYAMVDFKGGFRKLYWNEMFRSLNDVSEEKVSPEKFSPEHLVQAYWQLSRWNDWMQQDASFAKLREVSLSYLLPDQWSQSFGVRQASVTASGRNLMTWTDFTGLDPEASHISYNNAYGAGTPDIDFGQTPQPTQFELRINLTF